MKLDFKDYKIVILKIWYRELISTEKIVLLEVSFIF